jgi:hypothetical protein
MIEALGWISTGLVLVGYISNATGNTKLAMVTWIVGDIGWITYDFFIDERASPSSNMRQATRMVRQLVNIRN